jgi:hypothetical protein
MVNIPTVVLIMLATALIVAAVVWRESGRWK